MTTFDYPDVRDNIVEPALAEFGFAATLTQPGTPTGPDYDPVPGTPTTYAVTLLNKSFTMMDRSGGLVQENDRKFMMSTDGDPQPDLKGTLTVGSVVYQVVSMEQKGPGATTLFWNVHCRK